MRPDQEIYLADVIREHCDRLEEVVAELAERGEPISQLEARLIAEAGSVRLNSVEAALRYDAGRRDRGRLRRLVHSRAFPGPLRRAGGRTLAWWRPRIGSLFHYTPRELRVPAKYALAVPPDPAPTISIVTPSFQQGRFLERTLHSVVDQQYPALEYFVQDGESSDETIEVLRRFEQSLTGWKSEPDGGQADAINRGFEQTTGEIMGWLNSDDLLLPGSLAYVASYFSAHPKVDVVYGHRRMIDENDGEIGAWILPAHSDLALTLADYVPQETLFWRRRVWEAAGGWIDPSFGYALDWDLLLRFRDAGATMVRLPRFLGAFRIHDEQKTTAFDRLGAAECERLRQRVHGRDVPVEEVINRLRPYYVRHIVVHKRHRLLDRLPLRREVVRTEPSQPVLLGTGEEHRLQSRIGVPL